MDQLFILSLMIPVRLALRSSTPPKRRVKAKARQRCRCSVSSTHHILFNNSDGNPGLSLSSPFNMNLPLIDPSLPHLINHSPYTPSTSLSSSHPSPQDLGLFDPAFDSVTPQALGFNHEVTALSAHPLQSEHVFYYFDHVRTSLFAFTGNSAANAIYSVSFPDHSPDSPETDDPIKGCIPKPTRSFDERHMRPSESP